MSDIQDKGDREFFEGDYRHEGVEEHGYNTSGNQDDCCTCSRSCLDTTRRFLMIVVILVIAVLLVSYLLPAVLFFAFSLFVIMSAKVEWNVPKLWPCMSCSCCCCCANTEEYGDV